MPNKLRMQNIQIPVFYQYLCPKAYNLEHNFDWSMIFRICRLPAIVLKYFAAVCWGEQPETKTKGVTRKCFAVETVHLRLPRSQ